MNNIIEILQKNVCNEIKLQKIGTFVSRCVDYARKK